jgi:uncharacterized protein (UPF0548 family)
MLRLRKPSSDAIRDFIDRQARLSLTYQAVGETAGDPPPGYEVNRTRIRLGEGEAVFAAGKAALRGWAPFRLGWVELCFVDVPIEPGQVVGVLAHVLGIWSLNACNIVSVQDEGGSTNRFGFAYGTLPGHVQSGEERFLIEWNRHDDSVWYDLSSFSRPNGFLACLGRPYTRRKQRQFARDSAEAMLRAVVQPRS